MNLSLPPSHHLPHWSLSASFVTTSHMLTCSPAILRHLYFALTTVVSCLSIFSGLLFQWNTISSSVPFLVWLISTCPPRFGSAVILIPSIQIWVKNPFFSLWFILLKHGSVTVNCTQHWLDPFPCLFLSVPAHFSKNKNHITVANISSEPTTIPETQKVNNAFVESKCWTGNLGLRYHKVYQAEWLWTICNNTIRYNVHGHRHLWEHVRWHNLCHLGEV